MRQQAVPVRTEANQRPGTGRPSKGPSRPRRRRTMGLCAHCHRPVELDQEHLRLYRKFWHVDCALTAHEPATD